MKETDFKVDSSKDSKYNRETIEILNDILLNKNLSKVFNSVEELFDDLEDQN